MAVHGYEEGEEPWGPPHERSWSRATRNGIEEEGGVEADEIRQTPPKLEEEQKVFAAKVEVKCGGFAKLNSGQKQHRI